MQADHVLAHNCLFVANQLPIAATIQALDKLGSHKSAGNMGKIHTETMQMHILLGWPGQCTPNLSHACHTVQILPPLVVTATKTAHSVYVEHFVGSKAHFKRPAAPQEPAS